MLFDALGLQDTRSVVEQTIHPVAVMPRLRNYLAESAPAEESGDLAD